MAYLVAAVQTVAPEAGARVLELLQSPQLPSIEALLIGLLNDIASLHTGFTLVLDDDHLIEQPAAGAVTFMVDHLPPQMHLVVASREEPDFPLARLRARGQLLALKAADLRFAPEESVVF